MTGSGPSISVPGTSDPGGVGLFERGPNVAQLPIELSGGQLTKPKVLVKRDGLIIDRVNDDCASSYDLGSADAQPQCLNEQTPAIAMALPPTIEGKTGEEDNRDARRHAPCEPARASATLDRGHRQGEVASDLLPVGGHPHRCRPCTDGVNGTAVEPIVQGWLPTIEIRHIVDFRPERDGQRQRCYRA